MLLEFVRKDIPIYSSLNPSKSEFGGGGHMIRNYFVLVLNLFHIVYRSKASCACVIIKISPVILFDVNHGINDSASAS